MGYENSAGLAVRNFYGPRTIVEKFGGEVSTSGLTKEAEWVFSYNDLPVVNATGEMELSIPAGAFISSAKLEVLDAFVGGTSYNIGLYESDGTEIDADGIDAGVLTAALIAGAWIDCNGALVGASIGSAAGQLVVAATGTFTAGKARLLVEYEDSNTDGTGNYVAGGVKGAGA
jgi:hypothetical protein